MKVTSYVFLCQDYEGGEQMSDAVINVIQILLLPFPLWNAY
jgi:hypothetical protein